MTSLSDYDSLGKLNYKEKLAPDSGKGNFKCIKSLPVFLSAPYLLLALAFT
ncbi:hypothetical protein ALT1644_230003 [Alteromonas macleodii]